MVSSAIVWLRPDHPDCAASEREHSFDGAATPPSLRLSCANVLFNCFAVPSTCHIEIMNASALTISCPAHQNSTGFILRGGHPKLSQQPPNWADNVPVIGNPSRGACQSFPNRHLFYLLMADDRTD